jgi:hypothetical protein
MVGLMVGNSCLLITFTKGRLICQLDEACIWWYKLCVIGVISKRMQVEKTTKNRETVYKLPNDCTEPVLRYRLRK